MGNNSPVSVTVNHRYSIPSERVFDAWLDPGLLGQWMFGPRVREEEILHLHVDGQVGGNFSFLVRRQGHEIDHIGTYRVIDRPSRLVFTWGVAGESADESLVTIELHPVNGGCEATLTHDMDSKWADYADRARGSWTKMLEMLDSGLSPA